MPRLKKSATPPAANDTARPKPALVPPPANPCGEPCEAGCVAWFELEGYGEADLRQALDRALTADDGTPMQQTHGDRLQELTLCPAHAKRRDALVRRAR